MNYMAVIYMMHGEPLHGDMHAMKQMVGKLIATHLTIHLNGGPFLARGTTFGCQNWSPGPILAAKICPGEPLLGETNFRVIALLW